MSTAAREVAEANRQFLAEATKRLEQREAVLAAREADLVQREQALAVREKKLHDAMAGF
jgi:hypothetical protein